MGGVELWRLYKGAWEAERALRAVVPTAAGEAFYTLYEMVRDAVVMIIKTNNTTKLVVDVE